jgi:hypothetical protein
MRILLIVAISLLALMAYFEYQPTQSNSRAYDAPQGNEQAPHHATDWGDVLYMNNPAAIVQAIRQAEGVPSYGLMNLAKAYGGIHMNVPDPVGRRAAGDLLHHIHAQWIDAGTPGPFLEYLQKQWAPEGASNDPKDLNKNWLRNVQATLQPELGRVMQEKMASLVRLAPALGPWKRR